MSGLCGWFDSKQADTGGREIMTRMAASITRFDGSSAQSACADFGAVAAAAGAPGDHTSVFEDGNQLAAVWGRMAFADADLAELARRGGAAQALVLGYARKGKDLFAGLSGSFALAILDRRTGEALLAIDRMGTRRLGYHVSGSKLVFGSTVDAISAFPNVNLALNHQAIYSYVYFHMVPAPEAAQTGVQFLLPGEYLSFSQRGTKSARYWEMHFVENDKRSFAELKPAFLAVVRDSVRSATSSGKVGAFLSGGTDSSTISGMLGQVSGAPAHTYSIGFEAEGFDEMEYARIAAKHFGTDHHEYYVTPDDVIAAVPKIAAVHDQPFGNASAIPTYYCAKLAKSDGVDTLLGGDGGDELFGGNERYAKQHLYSLYSDLPSALRKGLIEPIAFAFPEVSVIGKAQRYMRNASQPMPGRYDNYNLLERLGAANVFTAEFLATVNAKQPQSQVADSYQQAHAKTLINRMLALDFKYTLADNDLPKVTRSCELAGVDVSFPLLDDTVVAFSANLAPGLKLKGTRLRYFFKEALREFLPDEIITKTKHGFGLPFGVWLQTHPALQQIAQDSLADLRRRNIIRPAFIDELTSSRVPSHANYYGTMVWVLMMLEQWFKQRRMAVKGG